MVQVQNMRVPLEGETILPGVQVDHENTTKNLHC